jgi:hypothetical protein
MRNVNREVPVAVSYKSYKLWLVYYSCFSSIDCIFLFHQFGMQELRQMRTRMQRSDGAGSVLTTLFLIKQGPI